MGLRERVRQDNRVLNNRDWGQAIELVSPNGIVYKTDAVTGATLKAAQILYDYRRVNPDTGCEMTINEPVVVIHRDSLTRVPLPGEKWIIRIPLDANSALLVDYVLSPTRPPEGGRSIGFIRLYPQKVKQKVDEET